MKITSPEMRAKQKELNKLIDEFFSLSKDDEKSRNELIKRIRKLQDEVDNIYNRLKKDFI